jgi:RNA polymerase sigma factor (sigma-70 family)
MMKSSNMIEELKKLQYTAGRLDLRLRLIEKNERLLSVVENDRIREENEEFRKEARQMYDEIDRAESFLEGLPEPEGLLLKLRYIAGATWEEVAREVGYTPRYVQRLHKKVMGRLSGNDQ